MVSYGDCTVVALAVAGVVDGLVVGSDAVDGGVDDDPVSGVVFAAGVFVESGALVEAAALSVSAVRRRHSRSGRDPHTHAQRDRQRPDPTDVLGVIHHGALSSATTSPDEGLQRGEKPIRSVSRQVRSRGGRA